MRAAVAAAQETRQSIYPGSEQRMCCKLEALTKDLQVFGRLALVAVIVFPCNHSMRSTRKLTPMVQAPGFKRRMPPGSEQHFWGNSGQPADGADFWADLIKMFALLIIEFWVYHTDVLKYCKEYNH